MRKHSIIPATLLLLAVVGRGGAQTQVDLQSQGRNIDFRNAASTSPIKSGTFLPAVCGAGEMFLELDAPPGQNLFACVATNTWVRQGNVSASNLELRAGVGIVVNSSQVGGVARIESSIDSAVVQTKASAQSGEALRCNAASADGRAYTCRLTPTLSGYTAGMAIYWRPEIAGAGGAMTLNIDELGAIPIRAADGITEIAALVLEAGRLYQLWYDGTVFRPIHELAARLSESAPPSAREIGFVLCASVNCAVNDTVSVPRLVSGATAGTLIKLSAAVGTPPAGAALEVDLKIGNLTTATVTIPAGATIGSTTAFVDATLAEGDLLKVVITGVGSTTPGRDMHLIAEVQ